MYYLPIMKRAQCWYSNPEQPRSCPLNVAALAVRERMEPMFVDRPSGLNDYLFIHFHDPVQIWLGGKLTSQPRHTLVIWPPRSKHLFGNSRGPWTHTWMYGSGTKVASWLAFNGLPLEQPIHLRSSALADRYVRSLYEELHRHARCDDVIIESFFSIWMRELSRASQSSSVSRPIPDRLLAARQYLEDHLAQKVSLSELSIVAALSVSQFSAVFKEHFGTSPIDYLLALRMRQSVYHLSDLSFNVTEIGRKVGFDDPFYFSKQFKKHFGMSPRNYRRTMASRRRDAR